MSIAQLREFRLTKKDALLFEKHSLKYHSYFDIKSERDCTCFFLEDPTPTNRANMSIPQKQSSRRSCDLRHQKRHASRSPSADVSAVRPYKRKRTRSSKSSEVLLDLQTILKDTNMNPVVKLTRLPHSIVKCLATSSLALNKLPGGTQQQHVLHESSNFGLVPQEAYYKPEKRKKRVTSPTPTYRRRSERCKSEQPSKYRQSRKKCEKSRGSTAVSLPTYKLRSRSEQRYLTSHGGDDDESSERSGKRFRGEERTHNKLNKEDEEIQRVSESFSGRKSPYKNESRKKSFSNREARKTSYRINESQNHHTAPFESLSTSRLHSIGASQVTTKSGPKISDKIVTPDRSIVRKGKKIIRNKDNTSADNSSESKTECSQKVLQDKPVSPSLHSHRSASETSLNSPGSDKSEYESPAYEPLGSSPIPIANRSAEDDMQKKEIDSPSCRSDCCLRLPKGSNSSFQRKQHLHPKSAARRLFEQVDVNPSTSNLSQVNVCQEEVERLTSPSDIDSVKSCHEDNLFNQLVASTRKAAYISGNGFVPRYCNEIKHKSRIPYGKEVLGCHETSNIAGANERVFLGWEALDSISEYNPSSIDLNSASNVSVIFDKSEEEECVIMDMRPRSQVSSSFQEKDKSVAYSDNKNVHKSSREPNTLPEVRQDGSLAPSSDRDNLHTNSCTSSVVPEVQQERTRVVPNELDNVKKKLLRLNYKTVKMDSFQSGKCCEHKCKKSTRRCRSAPPMMGYFNNSSEFENDIVLNNRVIEPENMSLLPTNEHRELEDSSGDEENDTWRLRDNSSASDSISEEEEEAEEEEESDENREEREDCGGGDQNVGEHVGSGERYSNGVVGASCNGDADSVIILAAPTSQNTKLNRLRELDEALLALTETSLDRRRKLDDTPARRSKTLLNKKKIEETAYCTSSPILGSKKGHSKEKHSSGYCKQSEQSNNSKLVTNFWSSREDIMELDDDPLQERLNLEAERIKPVRRSTQRSSTVTPGGSCSPQPVVIIDADSDKSFRPQAGSEFLIPGQSHKLRETVSQDDSLATGVDRSTLARPANNKVIDKHEQEEYSDSTSDGYSVQDQLSDVIPSERSLQSRSKRDLSARRAPNKAKDSSAQRKGEGSKPVVEKYGLQLYNEDFEALMIGECLNDKIVNFYLKLLTDRSITKTGPLVYAYDSFFYIKLQNHGYKKVKSWTRQIDVFKHDILIVPIYIENIRHWCMVCVDFRKQTIQYYDSMGHDNYSCLEAIWDYLYRESIERLVAPLSRDTWDVECVKDIPMQENNTDCGVFMLKYAECIIRDVPLDFSQSDMPHIRVRIDNQIKLMKV